ncbi:CaiB/BaiF CoA-transferase family protein [Lysinibacillus sp. BW-2-10]|uniref:CaiB/BaiF CoA transferase family protein n=1 Tax=Lysinibacillus sp. BW-2-10 TaxID=2590030 RepID=UPI001181354D|nr:CaiB/BaiF CoA-transferase family protein [Lysinibacillus sp. BW-2-10]TSI09301.1 CoA transferase [Lysinibacillus sp. BW-2-10]
MTGILSGLKVLDLTQNIAGPFSTQLLGDLGATIIKVEKPKDGDDTRYWGNVDTKGESAAFMAVNRNKKSICIDLSKSKGIELVYELASKVDIFVHSMKPTTAEAKGLSYEKISEKNPSIIYGSISAFGEIGLMKNLPGYDPLIQAYTGIMSVTGNPDEDPVRVGVSINDMGSGMWLTMGILAALYKRSITGEGSKVTNSLLETGVAWGTLQLSTYMETGKVPQKLGTAMPLISPYEAFKTNDGWVMIAAGNNRLFEKLCSVLNIGNIAQDVRFVTNGDRLNHRYELHDLLENETQKFSSDTLIELLRGGGVPCSPINTLDKLLTDEQVNVLGLIKPVEHSRVKDFKIVDMPISINEERSTIQNIPPLLGEHSEEILKDLAGYTNEQIEALLVDDVVDLLDTVGR